MREADLDPLAADAAIDGTGRVRDSLDGQRLTGLGQIFRVAMYHENHPDGSYQMANLVLAFEPPRVISWKPGAMCHRKQASWSSAAGSGVTT